MTDTLVPMDLYSLENAISSWGKLTIWSTRKGCKVDLKTRTGFIYRDFSHTREESLMYVYAAVVNDLWTRCRYRD